MVILPSIIFKKKTWLSKSSVYIRNMHSTNEIRQLFLDYFAGHEHQVVSSGPLVPQNDPTLMFANAGMVQFKNLFIGKESRDYNRAVSSQKCVRAGGKHNDLENVGYTARHHTFFEMLGNFSFGDYFKDLAIELAWLFVTRELALPKDKLIVTVFAEDEEAHDLWKKIAGLSENRIIKISSSDNFWSMGETGPCGPCSEIFYDHGDKFPGGPPGSPEQDGDRFIEIWNLVFMQYEQTSPNVRVDLPRPSIDTGMGLERITAVLQGTNDNYSTDLFTSLINTSVELASVPNNKKFGVSHRVIADHLRASSFLIADGVMPSNEGRGYVLRRIMRRAMRHVHLMGYNEPLMHQLVPNLINEMGKAFPELLRAELLISETLEMEEKRFRRTLDRGLKLLKEEVGQLDKGSQLPGNVAFKLYDTYGFPLDLTQDALRRDGYKVDIASFEREMEKQKEEARSSWKGSGEVEDDEIWFQLYDLYGPTEFLGYSTEEAEGQIIAIIKDGELEDEAGKGDEILILSNQTPFYAESGGQEGDKGSIYSDEFVVNVGDTTKRLGGLHIHHGLVEEGTISVQTNVKLLVNSDRRGCLRAHHSATHMLHSALRSKLGQHVVQKGSLVAEDRLRFDFSHPNPISLEDLYEIEREVNQQIVGNTNVATRLMSPEEAIDQGALALFGEKYTEEVRVVGMGDIQGNAYSTELCGGTHVNRTGDIGQFKLLSEVGVSAGIRRIEAVVGLAANLHTNSIQNSLNEVAALLKVSPSEVPSRVGTLIQERKKLEKEMNDLRRTVAAGETTKGKSELAKNISGIKFVGRALTDVPPGQLKSFADELMIKIEKGIVVLITNTKGKASLVVKVSEELSSKISAVELCQIGSKVLGGKGGGGRPDMAQAGGPDSSSISLALETIETVIKDKNI